MSSRKNKDLVAKELTKETEAVEQINKKEMKQKPESVLKERVLKIHFESLKYNNNTYEFVYNNEIKNSADAVVKKYVLNCQKKIFNALNLRKIIKDFEITMALNDANTKDEDKNKNLIANDINKETEAVEQINKK